MQSPRSALVLFALTTLGAPAFAQLSLPAIFSDGMVLQRGDGTTVWGRARPGSTITVEGSWSQAPASATADAAGDWRVRIAAPQAGGPHTLAVHGDGERTFRDVWIGEVWFCSGQSNMEFAVNAFRREVGGFPGAEAEIAAADLPLVRVFDVPNRVSNHRRRDVQGKWVISSPKTAGDFSATAFYFARKLQAELGVPVGVVTSDWGGTPAEAWTSAEGLAKFPEFAGSLSDLAASVDPNLRWERERASGTNWWTEADRRGPRRVADGWTNTGFDASAWGEVELPSAMSGELGNFDGFAYFRTEIELPAAWEGFGATLELGPIDDRDDAWFDGQHVGAEHEDGRWNSPRRYKLAPELVKAGRRAIAVRVLDTGGIGGINGKPEQLRLVSDKPELGSLALAGIWRVHMGPRTSEMAPLGQGGAPKFGAGTPSALFNGMVAPLLPLTFRGALWYQGEANVGRTEQYERLFPALIGDWRKQFTNGEFPFLFVQIAPFSYGNPSATASAELRDAQRKSLSVPNTGMVSLMDLGDANDIHPYGKQEVGRRLALLALEKSYARKVDSSSGPLYRSMKVDGRNAVLSFDHAAGGLVLKSTTPSGWLIAGENREFFEATPRVEGDTLVLSHSQVPVPVAVRYAWSNVGVADLANGAGLPASSFRTDDWKGAMLLGDAGHTPYFVAEGGMRSLFNNRDLSGWINVNCSPSTWTVKDGRIECSGFPTGVLRTDRQYENFVFEMEWRHLVEQGNAGLFIWSDPVTARGQPFTRSVEVQVMTGMEGQGYTSQGDMFPIHGATMKPVNGRGGSRAFPTEARAKPGGQWNHYRVTCIDGKIELAVNGKVVTTGTDCMPRRGYLCLESEGAPAQFRNLRIKELPAAKPDISGTPGMVCDLDQGFQSLYNGRDFTGWKFGPEHEGHWKADDWTMSFDGVGTHLWSAEEFGDFELLCDWRWSGPAHDADLPVILPSGEYVIENGQQKKQRVQECGDSGIYLRGNDKSQVNIWCWPIGSGEVYGYRTDGSMSAAVRAGVTPRVNADAPLGEWNRFHITMKGSRLTVVLNGETVIENAELPGVPARGALALQQHGSPIQFANLYIKKLD
ncbi:MAG: DUF1080 domain-containing protein [Planctomycetaceae bacterium]|nr:DUF1080 domain-containing protein [Planctomycetaceae bacterium]